MVIRIEKWKNNKNYQVERDAKGRFLKGGKRIDLATKPRGYYAQARWRERAEKENRLYRNSWYVHGIPVHSTARNQRYYGFIIQGFSKNTEILDRNKEYLKKLLLTKAKNYLISSEYVKDIAVELGYENPIEISMNESLINMWMLQVEYNGKAVDSDGGKLNI